MIDDEDLFFIQSHTWNFCNRSVSSTIDGRTQQLGRLLLKLQEYTGLEADHKDRNPLNFQKINLRCVSKDIQQHNKEPYGKVNFKGVVLNTYGKYQAQIRHKGKYYYLGLFHTAEGAARAYNQKAIELYGELASLNKVEMEDDKG